MPEILVRFQILEIGFDQRVELLHLRDKKMFALDGSVDDLIEGGGRRRGRLRGRIANGKLRRWLRVFL